MIICEGEFDAPDQANPDYSMLEKDYYGWIPYGVQQSVPNHGLSLRRNLKTGEYEVFRRYANKEDQDRFGNSLATMSGALYKVQVAFHSPSLQAAINVAEAQWITFHGRRSYHDLECEHKPPVMERRCKRQQKEAKPA